MSNLLKSAIADAKTIRQTALENAKAALQEAFTPKLQSMLSKKIAEETEQAIDSEPAYTDGKKLENPSGANNRMTAPKVKEAYAVTDDETGKHSINLSEDGEEVTDELPADDGSGQVPQVQVPAGETELDVTAPDGAPVDVVPVGGGDVHIDPSAAGAGEEDFGGDDSLPGSEPDADALELESIIKELEDEANAGEEAPEPTFGDETGAGDEGDKEVNVAVGQTPDDVHVNFQDEEPATGDVTAEVPGEEGEEGDEQEIDLESILRELEEESEEKEKVDETLTTDQALKSHTEQPQKGNFGSDKTGTNGTPSKGGTEPAIDKAQPDSKYGKVNGSAGDNLEDFGKKTPTVNENKKLKAELGEYKKAVEYLRGKINEVNLLNAKLLYTNKLFRNFPLSNEQKVKVVEALDLTKNTREVKLVYTTLAESFSFGSSSPKKTQLSSTKRTITEGLASKPIASTKPSEKTILTEATIMANRFQKLAGIKPSKK